MYHLKWCAQRQFNVSILLYGLIAIKEKRLQNVQQNMNIKHSHQKMCILNLNSLFSNMTHLLGISEIALTEKFNVVNSYILLQHIKMYKGPNFSYKQDFERKIGVFLTIWSAHALHQSQHHHFINNTNAQSKTLTAYAQWIEHWLNWTIQMLFYHFIKMMPRTISSVVVSHFRFLFRWQYISISQWNHAQ